jgi:diguanylate cyclase (GGDEF)-like protein
MGRAVSWDDITHVKAPPSSAVKAPVTRDQAYLIVLAGSSMGEMYKITHEKTIIGRGQRADVRMMDEGVSREHCEILLEGEKIVLHDLGSTNGTYCRGLRIDRHELQDGDKILVGSGTVLKFTYHDKLDETFQRQMYESALRDDLTKAFNKKYFMDRVESEFAYAVRHNVPLSLVAFDIDHFKSINDSHGHPAGDYVLAELSSNILGLVRVEDVFARVGGEEFSTICRGADPQQGLIVAERLRLAVEKRPFLFDNKNIPVTISVGLASVPDPSIHDAMEFISAADQMLYEAKRSGRNRVCAWKAQASSSS